MPEIFDSGPNWVEIPRNTIWERTRAGVLVTKFVGEPGTTSLRVLWQYEMPYEAWQKIGDALAVGHMGGELSRADEMLMERSALPVEAPEPEAPLPSEPIVDLEAGDASDVVDEVGI